MSDSIYFKEYLFLNGYIFEKVIEEKNLLNL